MKDHANKSDKTIDKGMNLTVLGNHLPTEGLNKMGISFRLHMRQALAQSELGKKYLFENSSRNRFGISTKIRFRFASVCAFQ